MSRSHCCPHLGVRWAVHPQTAPQRLQMSGDIRLSPWGAAGTVGRGLEELLARGPSRAGKLAWDAQQGTVMAGQ